MEPEKVWWITTHYKTLQIPPKNRNPIWFISRFLSGKNLVMDFLQSLDPQILLGLAVAVLALAVGAFYVLSSSKKSKSRGYPPLEFKFFFNPHCLDFLVWLGVSDSWFAVEISCTWFLWPVSGICCVLMRYYFFFLWKFESAAWSSYLLFCENVEFWVRNLYGLRIWSMQTACMYIFVVILSFLLLKYCVTEKKK